MLTKYWKALDQSQQRKLRCLNPTLKTKVQTHCPLGCSHSRSQVPGLPWLNLSASCGTTASWIALKELNFSVTCSASSVSPLSSLWIPKLSTPGWLKGSSKKSSLLLLLVELSLWKYSYASAPFSERTSLCKCMMPKVDLHLKMLVISIWTSTWDLLRCSTSSSL